MNIYQRINAIMHDVTGVKKDSTNQHGRYKYAGHEAVTAALRSAYVKHGVVRSASVIECVREGGLLRLGVEVSWTNIEKPTDRHAITIYAEAPTQTKSGGATAQQSGVALSYAVKNAEFKVFALTGDDTPDADTYNVPDRPGRTAPQQQNVDFEELLAGLLEAEGAQELALAAAAIKRVATVITADQRQTLLQAHADMKARLK